MRSLRQLSEQIDRLNAAIGRGVAWGVLAMIAIGAYNAVARYVGRSIGVNLSSNAFIELQWYLFSLVFLLGAPWVLDDPGMSIKPWPNGALTHPAMTLLGEMIAAHGIAAADVARIAVRTNARVKATLIHDHPADAMQARFSMPFCLAALLVAGDAGLAAFTDEGVARADISAMMGRIDYGAFDTPGADFTNVTTLMTLSLADGATHEGRRDYARGSNRAPMSWDDITEKFSSCLSVVDWPEDKQAAAIEAVAGLESLDDIGALIAALTA